MFHVNAGCWKNLLALLDSDCFILMLCLLDMTVLKASLMDMVYMCECMCLHMYVCIPRYMYLENSGI